MSSTDERAAYPPAERRILLRVAARAIARRLAGDAPLVPALEDYPEGLKAIRATFVTLQIDAALRGCIGMLTAQRPLVQDVAYNACAAGFEDPRFPPLAAIELPQLDLHISVLSPPEPVPLESEADLLAQLRPGIDGLIIEERGRRGTFLPSVWEQLPTPALFLEHLRLKAGLPAGYWSQTLQISRYTAESFAAPTAELLDDSHAEAG
jgi:AmmeMemoRadiSam system protein A